MALTAGQQCLAEDFINFKARVKAEMLRRSYAGSLTAYGGSTYDYNNPPATGGQMKTEHINKIITPMNAVNTTGMEAQKVGDQADSIQSLNTILTNYENFPLYGSGTDCASSCSGLCSNTCGNTCSGCGYGCGVGCSGSCSGGCSGDCSGGCSCTCSGSCGDGCTQACGTCNGCSTNCWGGCSGNCWGVSSTGSGNGSWVK